MHSQKPPGVVQNWTTLQCSKHDIEQCGYDHAPVTQGRMRTQFPLPHGPRPSPHLKPTFCFFEGGVFAHFHRMFTFPGQVALLHISGKHLFALVHRPMRIM